MANMLEKTADFLVVLGAVNWGLGLFQGFNLVTFLLGLVGLGGFAWVVYLLVGLSGLSLAQRLYFKK